MENYAFIEPMGVFDARFQPNSGAIEAGQTRPAK
jgi:hypothetical protein